MIFTLSNEKQTFAIQCCFSWIDIIFALNKYSEIPVLRPPKIKTFYPLQNLDNSFLYFLHPVYLRIGTTFGTVQKWSLRPLLDSPKGGLNVGILLYFMCSLEQFHRGGFKDYPQSMFSEPTKNKKTMYYPANPSFLFIKWGLFIVFISWAFEYIRDGKLLSPERSGFDRFSNFTVIFRYYLAGTCPLCDVVSSSMQRLIRRCLDVKCLPFGGLNSGLLS